MIKKIKQYLSDLEKEKNIKILWACETGSRTWGFPSTDSDYDVRLIYVHKVDWYLNLTEKKDNIERMFDNNDIDITGWELKKSLKLLGKSNAAMLERIQSSIVYMQDETFVEVLRTLGQSFYSKITTMHHYLSMAKKGLDNLESMDEFKLKKFFYTLRAALVCKWIMEKDVVPPIIFSKIYRNLDLKDSIPARIEELIELKSKVTETYFHKGEKELVEFIKLSTNEAYKMKNTLPTAKGDMEALNELFKKYIYKYNDN